MSNNPTIADLERAWATTPNLKIRKSDAEGALKSLNSHKSFTHIDFSSKNGFKSRYLTDMIAEHRRQLEMMLLLNNTEYDTDEYRMYKGIVYSWDLSMVPGLWKVPFSFTFNNLIVLNLDLCTALYWAIPIITATSSNNFRRLIIQRIDDLHVTAFPFPFTELDHCLVVRPLLKVILVYCGQECTTIFRREMPLLNFGSNLKFLKERKYCSTSLWCKVSYLSCSRHR